MNDIRGLLIDVDGVLHVDGDPISGAAEALERIRGAGIAIRLLTNGTMRTRNDLAARLRGMGIVVSAAESLTAVTAAADYLRQHHPGIPCHLLVSGDIASEFENIPLTDDEDEAGVVVVGGASDTFSFAALNRAYRMLRNGANLVAMHKSVHWLTSDGITLDSGPFIHGLEWAAGTEAVVVGKPSRHFFQTGFDELGLEPARVAMIGDDPLQDVKAAMDYGATGILVQTGLGALEPGLDFAPDLTLSSIAALPDALLSQNAT
ncbi:MAG: TIGR01458 family HAD-type hydrolase [Thermomicrobiales bacterium]